MGHSGAKFDSDGVLHKRDFTFLGQIGLFLLPFLVKLLNDFEVSNLRCSVAPHFLISLFELLLRLLDNGSQSKNVYAKILELLLISLEHVNVDWVSNLISTLYSVVLVHVGGHVAGVLFGLQKSRNNRRSVVIQKVFSPVEGLSNADLRNVVDIKLVHFDIFLLHLVEELNCLVQNSSFTLFKGHQKLFLSFKDSVVVSISCKSFGVFITFIGGVDRGIEHVVLVPVEVVKIQIFVGVVFINGGSVLGQSVDAVVNLLFLPNSGLAVALVIVILKLGDEVLVD